MQLIFMPAIMFLVLNVVIMFAIMILNRREGSTKIGGAKSSTDALFVDSARPVRQQDVSGGFLPVLDVLGWEFEYARITASEAMQDRLTMVNFYLLATGVITSGVVVMLSKDTSLPSSASASVGAVLLWLLCGVGWIHFLKIIRLRQAWHDSAKTMNRIKEFCIEHVDGIAPDELREAFRWKPETLPPPGKPWTVFFYSAMLIGFLDSVAYVSGGALLNISAVFAYPWLVLLPLCLLGLIFFGLHIVFYFAFLSPEKEQ